MQGYDRRCLPLFQITLRGKTPHFRSLNLQRLPTTSTICYYQISGITSKCKYRCYKTLSLYCESRYEYCTTNPCVNGIAKVATRTLLDESYVNASFFKSRPFNFTVLGALATFRNLTRETLTPVGNPNEPPTVRVDFLNVNLTSVVDFCLRESPSST